VFQSQNQNFFWVCFWAFSQVLKNNLVLDVIFNAKFEISNPKMVDSTIALNANHSKIQ
jgi:hypothetical protein